MKKILIVLTVVMLLLPMMPVSAADNQGSYSSKDEVVYAALQPNGNQGSLYIVNSFEVDEPGKITDFGNYTEVKNLTDLTEIKRKAEQVTFTAKKDTFYYQGDIEGKSLPWSFDISYYLDGDEIAADDILGKEGAITIEIDVSANEKADKIFFQNYLLQISAELDGELFEEIETEEGTIANSGKNKQVSYTVMPEQEKHFTLKANVTDFELQGINISAVPSTVAMDEPDVGEMKQDMKTLSDATSEIDDGVGELQGGISDLNSGVSSLKTGSANYQKGIVELDNGSSELISGSQAINKALETMKANLNQEFETGDFGKLQKGLTQIADGLNEASNGLGDLQDKYQQAYQMLDLSIAEIPDHKLTNEEIQALKNSDANQEVISKLLESYESSKKVKRAYQQTKKAFEAVPSTLETVSGSITELAMNLETMASELATAMEEMDIQSSMNELQAGVAELSDQYKNFHYGLKEYTNGVGELANSYGEVHNGISELTNGTSSLENGVNELKEGTSELANSTDDFPEELQTEVDKMINEYDKSDFDAVSFVSNKNEKVNSVQFVIQTDSITKAEEEETEEKKEEKKGIWERLLDLFR